MASQFSPYPFAALNAPVAPFTWECRADLAGNEESTGRIPMSFNRPLEVVGFFPLVSTVLPAAGGGLLNPGVGDIDVQLDLNDRDRFTNRFSTGLVSGAAGASHVALAALGAPLTQGGRLLRIVATNASPDFGVTFSWRQFIQGTPLFESARISLAFFARYLSEEELAKL